MPSTLPWLSTLLHLREHHHDVALQSLARDLQAANSIREQAKSVETMISRLDATQKKHFQTGALASERLRQIRDERNDLNEHLNQLRNQQHTANSVFQQSRLAAKKADSEAEVLRRLQDRLESARRQAQRHREEQFPLEVADSLCKDWLAD